VADRSVMTARETILLNATLADMKETDYKNILGITALIELLVEKGIITKAELASRARKLDVAGE